MRQIVILSLAVFLMAACVPVAKYNTSLNNLHNEKVSHRSTLAKLDSIASAKQILHSDFNQLEYQLSEIEKYASFTDYELIKEIEKSKKETDILITQLRFAKKEADFNNWLSPKRAASFMEDASCLIRPLSTNNFVVQKQNSVFIDTEGLMKIANSDPAIFKDLLIQIISPLKNQGNWKLNICLTIVDPSTDWRKIALQNEMMSFFAAEAHLPVSHLSSITRLVPQQKSPEFGYVSASRLIVEIEFS